MGNCPYQADDVGQGEREGGDGLSYSSLEAGLGAKFIGTAATATGEKI